MRYVLITAVAAAYICALPAAAVTVVPLFRTPLPVEDLNASAQLLKDATISDEGAVGFTGSLTGSSVNFFFIDGTLSVSPGDATNVKGVTISDVDASRFNNSGDIASQVKLEGEGVNESNDTAIVVNGQIVLQKGDQTPTGGIYSRFQLKGLNEAGEVLVIADETNFGEDGSLLLSGGEVIAKTSDPAPGDSKLSLIRITDAVFNENGDTAFTARLEDGVAQVSRGIFLNDQTIALEGRVAAGETSAVYEFFTSLRLNDNGDLGFSATLSDGDDTVRAVYLNGEQVARQGDFAPGFTEGQVLAGPSLAGLSDNSDVLILSDAALAGRSFGEEGLFLQRADGGPVELVLRALDEFDNLPLGPGSRLDDLRFSEDPFNSSGQLVFAATTKRFVFEEQGLVRIDGLLTTAAVPVPAPLALLLASLGGLALLRKRGGFRSALSNFKSPALTVHRLRCMN